MTGEKTAAMAVRSGHDCDSERSTIVSGSHSAGDDVRAQLITLIGRDGGKGET
jgi:hypothetical protein